MSTPTSGSVVPMSPLLALPAELRNLIYKYALGGNHHALYETTGKLHFGPDTDNLLALLRTSRQVYSETHLIVYSHNIFAFSTTKSVHKFLNDHSTEQKAAIRTLALQIFSRTNMINERKALKASDLRYLSRLTGLRNVQIWDYYYDGRTVDTTWVGGVWAWTGGRNMKVDICRHNSDLLSFQSVETVERNAFAFFDPSTVRHFLEELTQEQIQADSFNGESTSTSDLKKKWSFSDAAERRSRGVSLHHKRDAVSSMAIRESIETILKIKKHGRISSNEESEAKDSIAAVVFL
ncbi:hypothetical protein HBH56_165850 [Parastagonospora nodorum]|nr:hypothetical protein HBH56_165850 [Parastagonospora nodorum]KAH3936031.1 hypothetical protein HBH54_028940 [Parastagonospora nodorum]KAH4145025.1 hypothetical protein HBH45_019430 [Parastagonospora nodorum]KAH4175295.1 hypothetical protein HBH44_008440 [Parastagonospora nodorum]KAH4197490.1 hypothetical protein HBH42_057980 [Parastagonospora nodorum]